MGGAGSSSTSWSGPWWASTLSPSGWWRGIARRIYRRVRLLPLWQQGVSVFGVMMVDQLIVSWVTGMRGLPVDALAHLSVPLAGAVVWPWIFLILRRVRRRYQVE